jgi:hypothetical protein
MGSALVLSGLISKLAGWQGAWLTLAVLVGLAAAALFALRQHFLNSVRRT